MRLIRVGEFLDFISERIIQIAMFALLYIGVFNGVLSTVTGALLNGTLKLIQLIPIFQF